MSLYHLGLILDDLRYLSPEAIANNLDLLERSGFKELATTIRQLLLIVDKAD